jgi:hypothetical protein
MSAQYNEPITILSSDDDAPVKPVKLTTAEVIRRNEANISELQAKIQNYEANIRELEQKLQAFEDDKLYDESDVESDDGMFEDEDGALSANADEERVLDLIHQLNTIAGSLSQVTTTTSLDQLCKQLGQTLIKFGANLNVIENSFELHKLHKLAKALLELVEPQLFKAECCEGQNVLVQRICLICCQQGNWQDSIPHAVKECVGASLSTLQRQACSPEATWRTIQDIRNMKDCILNALAGMTEESQNESHTILNFAETVDPVIKSLLEMATKQFGVLQEDIDSSEAMIFCKATLAELLSQNKMKTFTHEEQIELLQKRQEESNGKATFKIVPDDKAEKEAAAAQKKADKEAEAAQKKAAKEAAAHEKAEKKAQKDAVKTAFRYLRSYAKNRAAALKKADAQAAAAQKKAAAAQKKVDKEAEKEAKFLASADRMARDASELKLRNNKAGILKTIDDTLATIAFCDRQPQFSEKKKSDEKKRLVAEKKKLALVEKAIEIQANIDCKKRDRRDRSQSQPTGLSPLQNKQRVDNATGDGAAGEGPRTCLFHFMATNDTTNVIVDPATQEELASLKKTLEECRKDLNKK